MRRRGNPSVLGLRTCKFEAMLVLAVRSLTKSYGARRAIDGADLTLAPGEVRGLLGANGAGKTTILRMLLGLVRPDEGAIEVFGRTPRWADDALSPLVAGFVEEPAFYPYLSARANLEVLARLDGSSSRARVMEVLEEVELDARAEERVAGYSTGMRQRLGIASALLRSPRLMVLDEPTAGLDPAGMRFVQRLVVDLAARGVAVLLSSHHIAEVERVCDTFTVLRSGKVVWDGTSTAMRAQAPPASRYLATSDDVRAAQLAAEVRDLTFSRLATGELVVSASDRALDAFVLALGRSGVAVRRLEQSATPLEAMFFRLTEQGRESSPTLSADLAAEAGS
jgi:ABC-2 type transport system ATP-binding protein